MKRGPKPSNGAGATSGNGTLVKSTYMLQSTLKQNLAYLALERGLDQSDIVRTALEDYLKKEKIDPTKPPKVSFRSPD
jgi:hypothetical protein